MWLRFSQFAFNMFMTADDHTPCTLRVFGVAFAVISTAVYFALAIHTVIGLKQPLDYAGFGGGLAAVWGVVAGCIALKSKSERNNRSE